MYSNSLNSRIRSQQSQAEFGFAEKIDLQNKDNFCLKGEERSENSDSTPKNTSESKYKQTYLQFGTDDLPIFTKKQYRVGAYAQKVCEGGRSLTIQELIDHTQNTKKRDIDGKRIDDPILKPGMSERNRERWVGTIIEMAPWLGLYVFKIRDGKSFKWVITKDQSNEWEENEQCEDLTPTFSETRTLYKSTSKDVQTVNTSKDTSKAGINKINFDPIKIKKVARIKTRLYNTMIDSDWFDLSTNHGYGAVRSSFQAGYSAEMIQRAYVSCMVELEEESKYLHSQGKCPKGRYVPSKICKMMRDWLQGAKRQQWFRPLGDDGLRKVKTEVSGNTESKNDFCSDQVEPNVFEPIPYDVAMMQIQNNCPSVDPAEQGRVARLFPQIRNEFSYELAFSEFYKLQDIEEMNRNEKYNQSSL